jgi:hypothetical protein
MRWGLEAGDRFRREIVTRGRYCRHRLTAAWVRKAEYDFQTQQCQKITSSAEGSVTPDTRSVILIGEMQMPESSSQDQPSSMQANRSKLGVNLPEDDPNRRVVFTEACQMFRHFTMMRYHTMAAFGVANAGFYALYFQYHALPDPQKWAILGLAVTVSACCIVFDLRIAVLIYHFHRNIINEAAKNWHPTASIEYQGTDQERLSFLPPDRMHEWLEWLGKKAKLKFLRVLDSTSIAAICIYLFAAVLWSCFANPLFYTPPEPGIQKIEIRQQGK